MGWHGASEQLCHFAKWGDSHRERQEFFDRTRRDELGTAADQVEGHARQHAWRVSIRSNGLCEGRADSEVHGDDADKFVSFTDGECQHRLRQSVDSSRVDVARIEDGDVKIDGRLDGSTKVGHTLDDQTDDAERAHANVVCNGPLKNACPN